MSDRKIILGIESSCDETSVAVCLKDGNRVKILSNIVASSASLQAKYGGIVPEAAAREQLLSIIPVLTEALSKAQVKIADIDAIAVTEGPGLIGSLLIGVETAKTLSLLWNKPLIPVNHLIGHFYANWIEQVPPTFPALGLLVSGGHTDLILFSGHGKYKYLGGTRDDAAGECFDKCARLLNLPYPGGPQLSKLAEGGNTKTYSLPRPMHSSGDFDFSFSGLKTAVYNQINQIKSANQQISKSDSADTQISSDTLADLAASIEDAITDVLVEKAIAALQTYKTDQLIIAGGVSANKTLVKKFTQKTNEVIPHARVFIPPPALATDNAAPIAAAAFFTGESQNPLNVQANPNLSLSVN